MSLSIRHSSHTLRIGDLLRPHWQALALALLAVLGETATDVLEPWPLKIVIDNVVQAKPLPRWLGWIVSGLFAHHRFAVLNFAVAAVALIAIMGALSTYAEKYLTTNVSQWVAHDLRLTLYHHIQRLSLADHDQARTGDLITRVTDDIGSVQDFINSALLGIFVNLLTLVGMIGVMLWVDWRFTLIALSIAPVLFVATRDTSERTRDNSSCHSHGPASEVVSCLTTQQRVASTVEHSVLECNRRAARLELGSSTRPRPWQPAEPTSPRATRHFARCLSYQSVSAPSPVRRSVESRAPRSRCRR